MPVMASLIERGLNMLQIRRASVGQPAGITPRDRIRVAEQLELSREPWDDIRLLLCDFPDVAEALDDLWPEIVPYLIKGNEVSPIHHIPYVVRFMARICRAEVSPDETRRGVLAALFHDVGIGDCALPKISEASIQRASGEERLRLRRDGIASRLEHMQRGAQIASRLLEQYRQHHPAFLTDQDVITILDIIGSHDNSKIPLMEDHVDRKWLLRPGQQDWLKQCHWEADALWMLTPAGILVDLEREREENTPETRRAKLQFNLGLHRQIITLYAQACSPAEMVDYGFHDGLLYRTATGFALAKELAY